MTTDGGRSARILEATFGRLRIRKFELAARLLEEIFIEKVVEETLASCQSIISRRQAAQTVSLVPSVASLRMTARIELLVLPPYFVARGRASTRAR